MIGKFHAGEANLPKIIIINWHHLGHNQNHLHHFPLRDLKSQKLISSWGFGGTIIWI